MTEIENIPAKRLKIELDSNDDENLKLVTDNDKPFHCRKCLRTFKFFIAFALHVQLEHQSNVKKDEDCPEVDGIHCEACFDTFETEKEKNDHVDKRHYGTKGDFVHKNELDKEITRNNTTLKLIVHPQATLAQGTLAANTIKRGILDASSKIEGIEVMQNNENPHWIQCGFCVWESNQCKLMYQHMNTHRCRHPGQFQACCLPCDETFKSFSDMKSHMSVKHGEEFVTYRCSFCKFGSDSLRSLMFHKKSKHFTKTHYKCEHCSVRFFNEKSLKNHIKREHSNAQNVCKLCDAILDKKSIHSHMVNVHKDVKVSEKKVSGIQLTNDANPDIYACSSCQSFKATTDLHAFMEHCKVAHAGDETSLSCGICSEVCLSVISLRKHLRKMHKTEYQTHRCNHCKFGTWTPQDLEAHKVQEHPELEQHICNQCEEGKTFFSKQDLQNHIQKKHNDKALVDEESKTQCKQCFKVLSSVKKLKEHTKNMHGIAVKCDTCGLSCPSKESLDFHKKTKHQSQDLKSNTCQFGCGLSDFQDAKGNVDHLLEAHHSVESRQCVYCSLLVQDLNKLRIHYYAVHLKMKLFSCSACNMDFAHKKSAQRHVQGRCKNVANELRPKVIIDSTLKVIKEVSKAAGNEEKYTCLECQLRFKWKGDLDKHNKQVHGLTNDVQCQDCGKVYSKQTHLNQHIIRVHQDEALKCDHCKRFYANLTTLRTHLRTVHNLFVEWTPEELDPGKMEIQVLQSDISDEELLKQPKECPALNCDFESKSMLEMKNHCQSLHYGRPYQCERCGLAFMEEMALKKHFDEDHLGLKAFVCDACGNGFLKKYYLDKHQRGRCRANKIHTCKDCGDLFNSAKHLEKHRQKSHSVEYCSDSD